MRLPIWMGGSLLGVAHGLADATSGFLLFSQMALPESAGLFLIYNLLAFALQPWVGIKVDQSDHPQSCLNFALISMGLLIFSSPFCPQRIWGILICALALASAVFHVSAGRLCLQSTSPLTHATLFTAPGVLGLSLGTYAGLKGLPFGTWLGFALCLTALALALTGFQQNRPVTTAPSLPRQAKQDWWLMGLVGLIALRSLFWNYCQLQSPVDWLIWVGGAACLGKFIGGGLTAKWGIRPLLWPSLALALLGFYLGPQSLWLSCLGIAALQSSAPFTLTALGQTLPHRPALASGLALGFALALGGLPLLLNGSRF